MNCPKCGKSINKEVEYCPECGTKIQWTKQVKYCPNCNIDYDSKDTYCLKCGTKLEYRDEPINRYLKSSKPRAGMIMGIFSLVLSTVGLIISIIPVTNAFGFVFILAALIITIIGIFTSAFGIRYNKRIAIPALAINAVSNIISISFLIVSLALLLGYSIAGIWSVELY